MPRQQRFLTFGEAAATLGVSMPALQRRVEAGHLTSYADPTDFRVKLIDAQELERFMVPRPLRREGQEVAMANTA